MAKNKNDNDTLFIVLILVVAGLWLIYDKPLETKSLSAPIANIDAIESEIAKDYKLTNRKTNLKKDYSKAAGRSLSTITDTDDIDRSNIASPGLKLRGKNALDSVVGDISEVHSPEFIRPPTPDERISSLVERDYWIKEFEKSRDKEFIDAFLERALAAGVEIELDKNLNIIGIQRKAIPEPIRFPQSDSAGGSIK